jgi:hypothetical protein
MLLLLIGPTRESNAQFLTTWMDIGEIHHGYSEIGAHPECTIFQTGLQWPAILRFSAHYRAQAYWIGVKNWIDPTGQPWDYRVDRLGILVDGKSFFTPVETRLTARFEDTEVIVNGLPSFHRITGDFWLTTD